MAEPKEPLDSDAGVSRRNLFHILGSVPAVAAVTAGSVFAEKAPAPHHDHGHAGQDTNAKAPFVRKVFDDHQWHTVHVLGDLTIPADDRSGSASQAGVPEFLDEWIAFRTQQDGNEDLKAEVFGLLMWLDRESDKLGGKAFSDSSLDTQKKILDRVAYPDRVAKADHAWMHAFNDFRDLTVSGFFSSKVGVHDLPYLGNTAVAEWKGCDPKVWAIIEDRMKNGYKSIIKNKPGQSTRT